MQRNRFYVVEVIIFPEIVQLVQELKMEVMVQIKAGSKGKGRERMYLLVV